MPFYRVDLERNGTDSILVEADSAQDAERDGKALAPDLDFDEVAWEAYATEVDPEKYPSYDEYWTGGPSGSWELLGNGPVHD